jgi:hypothetical protein
MVFGTVQELTELIIMPEKMYIFSIGIAASCKDLLSLSGVCKC